MSLGRLDPRTTTYAFHPTNHRFCLRMHVESAEVASAFVRKALNEPDRRFATSTDCTPGTTGFIDHGALSTVCLRVQNVEKPQQAVDVMECCLTSQRSANARNTICTWRYRFGQALRSRLSEYFQNSVSGRNLQRNYIEEQQLDLLLGRP